MDVLSAIMDYEFGELNNDKIIELFQELVDSGLAWELQGSYGRTAARFIDAGLVLPPETDQE